MKKLIIPLSLMGLALLPMGCGAQDTNANIANMMSKSLNEMIQTTEKIKDIDENKLLIKDLNETTNINEDYNKDNTNNSRPIYTRRPATSIVKNNSSRRYDRTDNTVYNGNDRVYRPNNFGNRQYYKKLANQNVNNANRSTTTTYNSNVTNNGVTRYYRNMNNPNVKGNLINNTYRDVKTSDNYNYPNITSTTGTYTSDTATSTNRYYTSRYVPRYTDTVVTSNSALTNYLEKIQDLYTICNDTCAASYDLDNLKAEIVSSCQSCNDLLSKVKSGEIKLTNDQINTLTAYNNTLQGCINDLKSCKDCSEDVSIISTLKGNFSNNCDTLVAKYLKVLNNIDTNNSLCNNARCTVSEINNYISGICGEKVNNYSSRYIYDYDYDYNRDYNNTTNNQTNNNSNNQNNQNITNNQTQNNTNNSSQSNINNQNTSNSSNSQVVDNKANNQTNRNNTNNVNNTTRPNVSTNNQNNRPYTPNTNPYTKDIKEGSVGSMPNPFAKDKVNNTYGGQSVKTTTPSPNRNVNNGVTTLPARDPRPVNTFTSTPSPKTKVVNNNTNYLTDAQKVHPTTFSGAMMLGPQNVRAGVKTLELI